MLKYDLAIVYLSKAKSKGKDDFWLNCELGLNFGRLKNHNKALGFLKKASEIDKDSEGWIESEIGWNLGSLGQHKEAIKYLQISIEKKYHNLTWVKEEIAWNLAKLERYQEAINIYRETNKVNPSEETRKNILKLK